MATCSWSNALIGFMRVKQTLVVHWEAWTCLAVHCCSVIKEHHLDESEIKNCVLSIMSDVYK